MEEQTFRRQYSEGVAVQLRVPAQIPKIIEWIRQRGGEAVHVQKGQHHPLRRYEEYTNPSLTNVVDEAPEFIMVETEDGQERLNFNDWLMYEGGELEVYSQSNLEEVFEVPEKSNLVEHAKRELEKLGNGPMVDDHLIRMIQIFAEQGHSGSSAAYSAHILYDLLQFKNLKPLTNDPDEWNHVAEAEWGAPGGVWQSQRNSEAFSNDGGKTYYLLSDEREKTTGMRPIHTAEERS